MKLAWGTQISASDAQLVIGLCGRLEMDPSHLMACMKFESNLNPQAINAQSGASGVIQFMPRTATGLGTTVEAIRMMTFAQQMPLVEAYFRPYTGRLKTLDDVYMAILWPKAIGSLFNSPLFSAADIASKAYAQNKGLDLNADGVVTKGEACARVQRLYEQGMQPGNALEIEATGDSGPVEPFPSPEPPESPYTPDLPSYQPFPDLPPPQPQENPMLAALLPMVLQMFAPRAQAMLNSKLEGKPAEMLQPFIESLFNKVGAVTGVGEVKNDAQAVEAVAALQKLKAENSALVQQVEEHALDYLDKLAPLFDRLAAADKAENDAMLAGRNAAMIRQQASNPQMLQMVVSNVNGQSWMVLGGLVVALILTAIAKGYWEDMPDYFTVVLALAGPLFGQVMKERGAIIGYYFDGTPASNASSAINSQIVQAGNVQASRK